MDFWAIADASGLIAGNYLARVEVYLNDPTDPQLYIPVSLQVPGNPEITLPDSIVFDSTGVGQTQTQNIKVYNSGTDTLVVTDIISTDPTFTLDTTHFLVPPADSFPVEVSFSPPAAGIYQGYLVFTSNDPFQPVDSIYVQGEAIISAVREMGSVPAFFTIQQNYPNPFNPRTIIKFQIPQTEKIRLEIFNLLGQKVRTLINRQMLPGYYQVVWDGRNQVGENVATGVYIYRLQSEIYLQIRKMILLR